MAECKQCVKLLGLNLLNSAFHKVCACFYSVVIWFNTFCEFKWTVCILLYMYCINIPVHKEWHWLFYCHWMPRHCNNVCSLVANPAAIILAPTHTYQVMANNFKTSTQSSNESLNTWWIIDAICQHRSGSTLAWVMACGLMTPSPGSMLTYHQRWDYILRLHFENYYICQGPMTDQASSLSNWPFVRGIHHYIRFTEGQ